MPRASEWLIVAEDNAKAGEMLLLRDLFRPATSRFYYAAYQAAHATLLTTPDAASVPARGNWDHGPLTNVIQSAAQNHLGFTEAEAVSYRKKFKSAMDARVVADYGPDTVLEASSVRAAQKAATAFVNLAVSKGARSK
jgi:uncharacterized protein (UPF0332 family)